VRERRGGVTHNRSVRVEMRRHDTVPERIAWFGNWTVQFATGIEGHVESLAVPLEPAVAPIIFRRLP
jgi:hypothetical protein